MKKRYLFNILLGILIFAFLQYWLGIRESLEALYSADGRYLVLGVLAFFLSQAIRVVKWRLFYRQAGVRTTASGVAHFYFKLKFFGILTPGRVGEYLPALTSRRAKGPLVSFTTFDRLAESMITLTIAIVAFTRLLHGVLSIDPLPVAIGGVAVIAGMSYLCYRNEWMMGLAHRIGKRLEPFRHWKPVERLLDSEKRIALEIRNLQRSFRKLFAPKTLALILGITLSAVAVDLVFWWCTFAALGMFLAPSMLVAAVAIFNVTGFFSPTPAGMGVADAAFVIFLHSVGVTGAFGTFVLLLRLILYIVTSACYLLFHTILELGKEETVERDRTGGP
ncbi:MAG: lysylphosphatidylglycerol synthase transmembrane domain-containing protein [Candidatus Eisenbacteria bacterium]